MVAGELAADTVWEGRVELEGDVVVPAGVTLRLRPGASLAFAPKPRWSCAVFRSAPEGYPIEASSRELCDLVVFGRLVVEGTSERPALLGGAGQAWGGITVLGGGQVSLSHARLAGAQERLVEVFDDGRLEASECVFSDANVGVLAWGLSTVRLRDASLRALGCGLLCREGADAALERVVFERAREGVWCQHWSLARLWDCRLEDCSNFGAGAYDHARLSVAGGSARGCGRGLVGGSEAGVVARGAVLRANRIGIHGAECASLDLDGCVIEASLEHGAKFSQSSRARVRDCRFARNGLAGLFSENTARVTASGNDFEEPAAAMTTAGEGVLESTGNRVGAQA